LQLVAAGNGGVYPRNPGKRGPQINLTGSEGPGTVKAGMPSKKVIIKKAEQIKFSVQLIKLCFTIVIFL
jgi:hypothetical protein